MSVELLELGAGALGDLVEEVVFVGGATVALWITDPGGPSPRPTKDVDVIVEVASRRDYHDFEERLRGAGFRDEGSVICRWIHRDSGLVLDAMPTDSALLGFENRWQGEAFPNAVERTLPSGARIRAVPPVFLLATKLEAHQGRGKADLLGSRDFADIVALVDGREELIAEVRGAPSALRKYINEAITALLADDRLLDGVQGQLRPDAASQARAEAVVLARLRELAAPANS
jgi:predicted nucleotidyltransferase